MQNQIGHYAFSFLLQEVKENDLHLESLRDYDAFGTLQM